MTMTSAWARFLVPLFLSAQGLLVYWSAGTEHPPAPPSLDQFPSRFADWTELHEDPIDPDVAATLRADRLLSRSYANTAAPVGLLVAWFQSQRAGASQPHSPKVCLPASGWTPASTGELTVATADGSIAVNRYIVTSRDQRAVILYWYQSARRATAGEWASKFWLVADAVRDHRSDTALVRIVVEDTSAGDAGATLTAQRFARDAYPLLRAWLPK
ncbi:MAG TPA: EpsI family protein [Bryobacteraceae bacterium]|nr:EpsI family protein [Bryobacteraceae bacterium]